MDNVNVNISLPKKIVEYLDKEAGEHYLARAAVARQYLMEEVAEKMVLEARRKGYSMRKVAESTGITYTKVLGILAKTQVDEELYPTEEKE